MATLEYSQSGVQYGDYAVGSGFVMPHTIEVNQHPKVTLNVTTHQNNGTLSPITGESFPGLIEGSTTMSGNFRDGVMYSKLLGKRVAGTGDYTDRITTPDMGDDKPNNYFSFGQVHSGDAVSLSEHYEMCRVKSISIGGVSDSQITQTVGVGLGKRVSGAGTGVFSYETPTVSGKDSFDFSNCALTYDIGSGAVSQEIIAWQLTQTLVGLESYRIDTGVPATDRWITGWRNGHLFNVFSFAYIADSSDVLFAECRDQTSMDIEITMARDISGNEDLYKFTLEDSLTNQGLTVGTPILGTNSLVYTVNTIVPDPYLDCKSAISSARYA